MQGKFASVLLNIGSKSCHATLYIKIFYSYLHVLLFMNNCCTQHTKNMIIWLWKWQWYCLPIIMSIFGLIIRLWELTNERHLISEKGTKDSRIRPCSREVNLPFLWSFSLYFTLCDKDVRAFMTLYCIHYEDNRTVIFHNRFDWHYLCAFLFSFRNVLICSSNHS